MTLTIDYHNTPTEEMIGGKSYKFRSKLERNWAAYLQFLKESGEICDWRFEQTKFTFPDETRAFHAHYKINRRAGLRLTESFVKAIAATSNDATNRALEKNPEAIRQWEETVDLQEAYNKMIGGHG